MEKQPLITFSDVSYQYPTDEEDTAPKYAVKHIDLTIRKGEFTVVLGHNGSGKSTLAKLSNAILQPSGGVVTVNGMRTDQPENELPIRQTVGLVFQNPDNQIVATIVEEDVAFGPENLGVPPEEIRRRVDDALRSVGMYDYRFHEPHKLSGGQKQRVAIAGVMAMRTQCVVLDEPTAMLDPAGRKEVLESVHRLNRDHGVTVVLITHYMEEAIDADRVIVMNRGAVALDGTPREVFAQEEILNAAGLELPMSARLAGELRKNGVPIQKGVLTPDEFIHAYHSLVVKT